jgi:hypothetical protein
VCAALRRKVEFSGAGAVISFFRKLSDKDELGSRAEECGQVARVRISFGLSLAPPPLVRAAISS